MIDWIKDKLVPDARNWLKRWSTWAEGVAVAILAATPFDPIGLLATWNMIPPYVAKLIPPTVLQGVGIVLVLLAMMLKLVRQKKLEEARHDAA
jgi:hypothetical protein